MESISISVSELRCACADPEWRIAWKGGRSPSVQLSAPTGAGIVFGREFHSIADDFVNWLTDSVSREQAVCHKDEEALWSALYDQFAGEKLLEIALRGQVKESLAFKERLTEFCRQLATLRAALPDFHDWADLCLVNEHSISNVPFPFGDRIVLVSGRMDAVRMSPSGDLVIVDYKLTRGAHLKHDLLQLAIYAELLKRKKPGLKFHGLLEYYEPTLKTVEVSPVELETIFEEIVMPVLKELAEGKKTGPPSSVAVSVKKPPVVVKRADPPPAADDMSEAIRRCYAAFKLRVEMLGRQEAPQLVRYFVRPDPGVKVVSLVSRAEDLQVALSLPQAPLIAAAQGSVTIDIPREKSVPVLWKDVMALPEVKDHPSPVSFAIGIGVDGRALLADFQDSNMCHVLVAGSAGSGKSEFLKSLAASLVARNTPETLRLTLIDPKILTFGPLEGFAHLSQPVIKGMEGAVQCLENAVSDMDRRYHKLDREGFENIVQRYQAGKRDMPWHIIIFDEFADLILAGKDDKKQFETLVNRLAAKGRAAGIHLILATQRPDRTVVTGQIKANLPLKVCLRVASGINSQLVIEDTGGTNLLGRGDLLCDRGRGLERAQSPYITPGELAGLSTPR